jgi:hypothetical protein
MIQEINVTKYSYVKEICWGDELKSFYNHNYYFSDELNDLIYEEYDDDGYFLYYRVSKLSSSHEYLGAYYGVGGMFEDKNEVVQLTNEY